MPSSISSSENSTISLAGLRLLGGVLIVCVLLMATATEVLLRVQVQPQDQRPGHLELLAKTANVDAAFGDSHVARGFDARDGFVNLAFPSENIEDMIRKVDTFYEGRAPGRVIVQADPHLFAPYRLAAAPAELTLPSPALLITTPKHRPRLLVYWSTFFRNGGRLKSSVVQTASGALLSSGDLSLDTERTQLRDARSRLRFHGVASAPLVKTAQERYSMMLDKLVAKGADICLVTFPLSPAYNEARNETIGPSLGHAQAVAFFANEAYRIGGTHWDARSHVSDTRLFRDVDHLNSLGAQEFAPMLIDACFQKSTS